MARPLRNWQLQLLSAVVPLVLVAGSAPAVGEPPVTRAGQASSSLVVPSLRVTTTVAGLSHPWDVQQLPSGPLLITERTTRRLLVRDADGVRPVSFPIGSVWASGETGLMSLAIDPAFSSNRRFYTCHGRTTSTGGHDIAVVAWRLSSTRRSAAYVRTLLSGIQITTGRHGGCRLLIRGQTMMYVGTGDSAVGTNPQNLTSLNGKLLRLDSATGRPWPVNPFINSTSLRQRYVYTYGHRNIQGLALRSNGTVWTVEHGPDRDDEVNLVRSGGNYGWNPVPGYNETVPMTDMSLPGATAARWSSGVPTIATSGAAWVRGSRWGVYAGTLAVAALKGSRVVFMKFDSAGQLLWTRTPAALQNFGRLRSVTSAPNGDLLVTTANGVGDRVLRVRPVA